MGGATGMRDVGGLESALAQPRASFGGTPVFTGVNVPSSVRPRASIFPAARCFSDG